MRKFACMEVRAAEFYSKLFILDNVCRNKREKTVLYPHSRESSQPLNPCFQPSAIRHHRIIESTQLEGQIRQRARFNIVPSFYHASSFLISSTSINGRYLLSSAQIPRALLYQRPDTRKFSVESQNTQHTTSISPRPEMRLYLISSI